MTDNPERPIRKPKGWHKWKKGQSGNPMGRPKGSRHKFSEAFLADFTASWEKYGIQALEIVAKKEPSVYIRVAATVLPKEVETTVRTELDGMTDADLKAFIQRELALTQANALPEPSIIDSLGDIDTKLSH
jgi:hypothetical protein